jgi:hypothetical protein
MSGTSRIFARGGGRGPRTQSSIWPTGHDPFFGVEEESESILYGGALAWAPFRNRDWLKFHVLNVNGHRVLTNPGVNVGTVVTGERGDLWSFGTSSALFNGTLTLQTEIAFSKFDTNIADEFRDETDKAYRARLEGTRDIVTLLGAPVMIRAGTEYSFVGLTFRSPANPGVQPDRAGYSMTMDTIWKIATLAIGYSAFHDNTERLRTLPRVQTHNLNGALTIAPPDLPSAALTYALADQESVLQPEEFGRQRINNVQQTLGINSSYGREAWSLNLGGSVTLFDDKTPTIEAGDKIMWSAQVGGMVRPVGALTITPSFSFNRIDDKHKVVFLPDNSLARRREQQDTLTGTLTAALELVPKLLNLDIQMSASSSTSTDKTVNVDTQNGVARLTWNAGNQFWDWGRQAVGLRLNYDHINDKVANRDDTKLGIFLTIDFLAPYKL